ncbi:pseudouridine-5'-phosphate glycosidase [Tahibacter amnicola]|uniref:Pseudouridine-5'-phosphate glycosidase n=1 Tax=Tahibacter amnicola TaxID=2976241 RepID=A0ABY6BM66_9GAMM|nr:pseudouridine-5'-phosphate glycosidase [Tahibacter amnicola]UXI70582.1 pseudouridine-5'-phosphate glycosidase [Tahibacter amnicola]
MHPLVTLTPEVDAALVDGRPVVALESTIIAHGMPYPANRETAQRLCEVVREEGAVPAIIALSGGRIRVGLSDTELEQLAQSSDVAKVSRRDLPAVLASGKAGATTVASTMLCAHLAGIRVFATGGIGGVHRGAAESFDVSADLDELARTPVAVVSAGAKAILDLPKTLEYLETRSVPVIGYQTDTFPAFYSRSSHLQLELRCDSPAEVAALLRLHDQLGLTAGTLIANPVPAHAAMDWDDIDTAIQRALAEADRAGITGKAVTPFLLSRLVALTDGRSLATNRVLAQNNARLGAQIAVALVQRAP